MRERISARVPGETSGALQPHDDSGESLLVSAFPAFREGNPYTSLLSVALEQRGTRVREFSLRHPLRDGAPDVLHLHWPERLVVSPSLIRSTIKALLFSCILKWFRHNGTKVVWTVHNVYPHERTSSHLLMKFMSFVAKRLDGFITLSEAGLRAALDAYPNFHTIPHRVIPHGDLAKAYDVPSSKAAAREQFGFDQACRVVLHFGQIRAYKGVLGLISAFQHVSDETARLVIAGRPFNEEIAQQVQDAAARDNRVSILLRFLSDQELTNLIAAADLVALPFIQILHSGSAYLALGLERPVLVPHVGAMPELAKEAGPGWVRTYSGNLTPSELNEALLWASKGPPARRGHPLNQPGWDAIAKETVGFYQQVRSA